jgi:hypothetical protein
MAKDRYRPWRMLPKVPVIQKHLDEFYQFCYERHSIWVRRFIKKEPPPWTKDLILRDLKFTNVYRELDRGTMWYNEHIAEPYLKARSLDSGNQSANRFFLEEAEMELIWETILYRLLNRIETFEAVGIPTINAYGPKVFGDKLRAFEKAGNSVFTSAHLTLPTRVIGGSKIDKYIEVLDYVHEMIVELHQMIKRCTSMKELHEKLRIIPCVGPFISYEVCTDFAMVGLTPFDEDSWANPGPGCKKGIRIIFPDPSYISLEDAIKKLRVEQDIHFKRLGLNFPYLTVYGKVKPLTLRAIEHSLCEFSKYWSVQHKAGKARMIFRPKTNSLSETPAGQMSFGFKEIKEKEEKQ